MDKEEIKRLISAGRLSDADEALAAMPSDAEALYLRGRIAWKQGRKADAITFYEHALDMDPECEPAEVALEQAREVMDFFNTDLLNP